MRTAKAQISLGILCIWPDFALSAQRMFVGHYLPTECTANILDVKGVMQRLILSRETSFIFAAFHVRLFVFIDIFAGINFRGKQNCTMQEQFKV